MKCKTDFSSLIIIKHFKVLHIPQCQLYFTFYFHHARPESKKRDRQIDKERRETGLQVYKTRQTDGQRHVFLFSTVSVWYITENKLLFVCLLSLPHMLRVSLCFLCQCVLLLPSVCVYVWPPQTCQSCVYIFLVSMCVSVSCRFLKWEDERKHLLSPRRSG